MRNIELIRAKIAAANEAGVLIVVGSAHSAKRVAWRERRIVLAAWRVILDVVLQLCCGHVTYKLCQEKPSAARDRMSPQQPCDPAGKDRQEERGRDYGQNCLFKIKREVESSCQLRPEGIKIHRRVHRSTVVDVGDTVQQSRTRRREKEKERGRPTKFPPVA